MWTNKAKIDLDYLNQKLNVQGETEQCIPA